MNEICLCENCYRICKVRNKDRTVKVLKCDGFIQDLIKFEQTRQTYLEG